MEGKVAFITGASRGIGKASAVALAKVGYDVVVTARTIKEGEAADGRPLPGSIETTAAEVRACGREALAIPLDLLDSSSLDAAWNEAIRRWGRVDLLVNNGVYTGPGSLDRFLDLDLQQVESMFRANLFAHIRLTQLALPGMLQRERGAVINLISSAGLEDPPAPAGQGGWGFAYAASKAALIRMAGILHVEHAGCGVRFFNLEPGLVLTETMALNDPSGKFSKRFGGAPPRVPAAVIAWLASAPEAKAWDGKTVLAQRLCLELGLSPDWR